MDLLYQAWRFGKHAQPIPIPERRAANSGPIDCTPVKRRRSFLNDNTAGLASTLAAEANRPRGWLTQFCNREFGHLHGSAWHAEYERCRRIVRTGAESVSETPVATTTSDCAPKIRRRQVRPQARRRKGVAGRKFMAPEIREELFQWFVDTISFIRGRINSFMLVQQAGVIAIDVLAEFQTRLEEGDASESQRPRIPVFSKQWVFIWRLQYGISWRQVNLRLKCSFTKLVHRCRGFWLNIFSMRWLHYFLNGRRQTLRFVNSDEKPMWVTYAANDKTMARRSDKRVQVVENIHQAKTRFTVKTRTRWPALPNDNKSISILFRGKTARSLLDENGHPLIAPDGVLLQYGPKGSYRDDTNLDYYRWTLGDKEDMSDDECVLVDRFACNSSDGFHDLMDEKGRASLDIPGCTTGYLQNNDVTCHGPYAARYKARETEEGTQQLREGRHLPDSSKQTVIDRSHAAWHDLNHAQISRGFIYIGVAGDLFGTQDEELTEHDCRPIWYQLGMPEARAKIGAEIEAKVADGTYTNFLKDYKKLIIPPDDNGPEREGMEAFEWTDGGDDDDEEGGDERTDDELEREFDDADGGDDGDDGGGGGGGCAGDVAGSSGGVASSGGWVGSGGDGDTSGGCGGGSGGGPHPGDPLAEPLACHHDDTPHYEHPADLPLPPPHVAPDLPPDDGEGDDECEITSIVEERRSKAMQSLWSDADEKSLIATQAALEALKASGGDAIAEQALLNRVSVLNKKKGGSTKQLVCFLREQGVKRAEEMQRRGREREARDHEAKLRKLKLQKVQLEIDQQKVELGKARDETKKKHLALQAEKAQSKEVAAVDKASNRHKNLTLAGDVARRIASFLADEQNRIAIDKKVEELRQRKVGQVARKSTPPQLFDVSLSLFKDITLKSHFSKANSCEKVVASSSFAKFMFNGKSQDHASQKRPETALANQTETLLRGYNTLLPHEFRIRSLLVKHRGNCDTTFLDAVWYYSRTLHMKTFPGLYDAPMEQHGPPSSFGASSSHKPTHRVRGKAKAD